MLCFATQTGAAKFIHSDFYFRDEVHMLTVK
jgi:hypothetical protein